MFIFLKRAVSPTPMTALGSGWRLLYKIPIPHHLAQPDIEKPYTLGTLPMSVQKNKRISVVSLMKY